MDILDLTSSHVEEDVFVWVRKGNPQLLIGLWKCDVMYGGVLWQTWE